MIPISKPLLTLVILCGLSYQARIQPVGTKTAVISAVALGASLVGAGLYYWCTKKSYSSTSYSIDEEDMPSLTKDTAINEIIPAQSTCYALPIIYRADNTAYALITKYNDGSWGCYAKEAIEETDSSDELCEVSPNIADCFVKKSRAICYDVATCDRQENSEVQNRLYFVECKRQSKLWNNTTKIDKKISRRNEPTNGPTLGWIELDTLISAAKTGNTLWYLPHNNSDGTSKHITLNSHFLSLVRQAGKEQKPLFSRLLHKKKTLQYYLSRITG